VVVLAALAVVVVTMATPGFMAERALSHLLG
jgi:hypothetical protein